MARAFVADSDDEDENGFYAPPDPPHLVNGETEGPGRSSDHLSHATGSTDPIFFQSVFDEQNDAATHFAQQAHGNVIADVNNSADLEHNDYFSEVPDAYPMFESSVGTGGAHARAADVWEIPSSPEPPSGIRPRASLGKQQDTGSSQRKAKRRKIEASHDTQPQVNSGVNLHSEVHGEGSGHGLDASSLPMPTLPGGTGTSFFIAQDGLTDSQKLLYQSVSEVSSQIAHQNQPPGLPRYELKLESSGSATNANTPRDDMPSSRLISTAPGTQGPTSATKSRKFRLAQADPHSSPDIISLMQPEEPQAPMAEMDPITHLTSPEIREKDEQLEVVDEKIHDPSHTEERVEDNYEPDEPAPAKKSRGRPKKNKAEKAAPVVEASPKTSGKATTQKKKRGRPKKSDQPAESEIRPQDEPAPVDDFNTSTEVDATTTPKGDNDAGEEETKAKPTPAEDENTRPALAESNANSQNKPSADSSTKTPVKPPVEKSTPSASEKAISTKVKNITTSETKPLYRVGLSKRSRIAPLLKIIRK